MYLQELDVIISNKKKVLFYSFCLIHFSSVVIFQRDCQDNVWCYVRSIYTCICTQTKAIYAVYCSPIVNPLLKIDVVMQIARTANALT